MDKVQRTITLLVGYPMAVLRGLYRDRTTSTMLRFGVLLLFTHLMGDMFSNSLAARGERLEVTLAQAEMPQKQITAISAIVDDIGYEVRTFLTWLVVMTGVSVLRLASDRTDCATRPRKDIDPTPDT